MLNLFQRFRGSLPPNIPLTHLVTPEIPLKRNHPIRRHLKVTAMYVLQGRDANTTGLPRAMMTRHDDYLGGRVKKRTLGVQCFQISSPPHNFSSHFVASLLTTLSTAGVVWEGATQG